MLKLPNDVSVALTKLHSRLTSDKLSRQRCLRGEGREGGLQMLTAQRDGGLATARSNDVVDEAGERGDAADKEGDDGAPIGSVSGGIAVDTVKVVHVRYGHVTASDDKVAAGRD
jgi:hypothetical protein